MTTESATALYVHVPFCVRKCRYCDFFSIEFKDGLIEPYLGAIAKELHKHKPALDIRTIYIGGGTPTALSTPQLEKLLATIHAELDLSKLVEFTVEANPGTVDPEKFAMMKRLGVNRVSLGVQSFNDKTLALLGRIHDSAQAQAALKQARSAGFDNLSLDLIFGVPGQTMDDLARDLERAIAQDVEHISAYGLTFEEGTPLWADLKQGRVEQAKEETELEMYRYVTRTLAQAGFEHYEVSNYARPGRRSQHNQVYWRNEAYVGLGPGAVSYLHGKRSTNVKDVAGYVERMARQGDATEESEKLSARRRAGETAMLGLRMTDGIDEAEFARRTGFTLAELAGDEFERLIGTGLLRLNRGRLALTERGMEIADSVMTEFL